MKNLHLIRTDKRSRLRLDDGELVLGNSKLCQNTLNYQYQHIYITSDEKIKEGDYFYVKTPNIHGGNIVKKCLNLGKGCWSEHILTDTIDEKGYHPSHCKKIILTTDQNLIKDGVQAIDDEFLEWFVKNPSCESVNVEKLLLCTYCGQEHCDNLRCRGYKDSPYYKIIIPQEEPKQETLEEAAERLYSGVDRQIDRMLFIAGAKWQAERSYSEEEMIEFYLFCITELLSSKSSAKSPKELFEQFKKK
jgi:hypothetical protein